MAGRTVSLIPLVLALLLVPTDAHAYIGPGIGAGALAAVLGVLGSILVALFALIYYPIKRVLKKLRTRPAEAGRAG